MFMLGVWRVYLVQYLHFCYEDRRPYIAVNKHGDRVVVDLLPVEGLGGFHDPSRMDDIEDSLSELLQDYKVRHMQIVNKATEDQVRATCCCAVLLLL